MKRWTGMGVVAAAVACAGLLLGTTASAEKGKPGKKKKRAASVEQLMEGVVVVHCKALGKELNSEKPNWKHVKLHAAMLNESGHNLMDDGRCPSKEWAAASKILQKCSVVIIDHAKKEDLAGAKSAFKVLTTKGCAACHKKHKK
ncbi:MAG: hypothetical protein Tsb009_30450 [Planctomycetaceae bacterium]